MVEANAKTLSFCQNFVGSTSPSSSIPRPSNLWSFIIDAAAADDDDIDADDAEEE